MPKPSDYFLSEDDNAAIFEQQIRPAEFGRFGDDDTAAPDSTKNGRPVCIILAGQTGAGKSHTAPALAAALSRAYGGDSGAGYCHLVADTHKPYHPAYAGLVADAAAGKAPPGLASAATGHDARRWLARACAVAAGDASSGAAVRARPLPTLVESASRYPQDVVAMAGIFRRAGYHVCLVFLAVHAAQSRLGLLARYLDGRGEQEQVDGRARERETERKLPVRLTPRAIHDESYAGLAELARLVDEESGSHGGDRLADAVLVVRRGSQVAYANYGGADGSSSSSSSQWKTAPVGVGRVLAAERTRRTGDGESSARAEAVLFFSDVARLRATHPERADELDGIQAEYEAAMAGSGEAAGSADLGELRPLDPDALVAHLRSEW